MLLCDCKDCGGTEEPYFCENKLLQAQMYVAKKQQNHDFLIMTLAILILGIIAMGMA